MKPIKGQVTTTQMWGLVFIAYVFSFAIRLIWVYQFQDNANFHWNDQIMINTNDGYTWAAAAQNTLLGFHETNAGIRNIWGNGIIFFTVLFAKITPFSLETIILYMPAFISSIVVIPIIFISRLYNQTLWGFFAALLGSVAWSYYNRTMIGYYDTDMFAAMAPMFVLYFLMKSTIDFHPRTALYAALFIAIYPFLYDAGRSIVYAMGIIYALYVIYYHRDDKMTYLSLSLVFIGLIPFPLADPLGYLLKIVVLLVLYFGLMKSTVSKKSMMVASGVLFLAFMIFGNVFGLILGKVMGYLATGTQEVGLHFYAVIQTVREAGQIPFSTFANRISGSQLGLVVSALGYVALVFRHRAFILALPLVGIGVFALWGGLRFTVYAVPVAAMSAIYLFFVMGEFFKDKAVRYGFIILATATMIYPNITHIIAYKVPTVFKSIEVQDLEKLKNISKSGDYTLAWWDYGYPMWFYSNTNTIIDGGKHQNDNFIISKIMQTSSPELAANLSRLAVETYVSSDYKNISDTIFKNRQPDQVDPSSLLLELENGTYELPKKTRDIYLYLPYRMMNIFPTVAVFGNLDLTTGKKERKMYFTSTYPKKSSKGIISFANGIVLDSNKGELTMGSQKKSIKHFIVTQNLKNDKLQLQSRLYNVEGKFSVIYMKSYNKFVIMDSKTFNSTYVQMFILKKYDKSLFELVVSSPYSRIYKLKI